jgi:putative FmdB family regulatory protein
VPTYQYACTECDHRFDAIQSFSDPSLTECPVCGGKLRKVFSSVGIVFKGSGFYRTDSRSGGSGKDGGKDSKDGKEKVSADSTSSSGSSDSKGTSDSSAKKSDTKPASSSTSSTPAAASA